MGIFEQVIKYLPLSSGWFTGGIFRLCSNELVSKYLRHRDSILVKHIKDLKRLLVISDVNIGDAVTIQSCIETFRCYFPDSEIDYAYSNAADPMINKNPHISNTFPLFSTSLTPSKGEAASIRELLKNKPYDLVINFCPFLSGKYLRNTGCPVLSPVRLAIDIIRERHKRNGNTHISYYTTQYIHQLFNELPENTAPQKEKPTYSGSKIYLPRDIFSARDNCLKSLGISPQDVILYFNPDTSNSYTFINQSLQIRLLKMLLQYDNFDWLLLGSGIKFKGIEKKLYDKIPSTLQKKIIVLNDTLPLDVYASLLDVCDVFLTGDTGPMHIAAARKICVDDDCFFRNRVAVIGIFGATDSKIYGYDSFKTGYMCANQNAPSKVFEASPPCKTLACSIQRLAHECSRGRCFEGIDIDAIVAYVTEYLSSLRSRAS